MEHVKTPGVDEEAAGLSIRQNAEAMIANIRSNGEAASKEYARKSDRWTGELRACRRETQTLHCASLRMRGG